MADILRAKESQILASYALVYEKGGGFFNIKNLANYHFDELSDDDYLRVLSALKLNQDESQMLIIALRTNFIAKLKACISRYFKALGEYICDEHMDALWELFRLFNVASELGEQTLLSANNKSITYETISVFEDNFKENISGTIKERNLLLNERLEQLWFFLNSDKDRCGNQKPKAHVIFGLNSGAKHRVASYVAGEYEKSALILEASFLSDLLEDDDVFSLDLDNVEKKAKKQKEILEFLAKKASEQGINIVLLLDFLEPKSFEELCDNLKDFGFELSVGLLALPCELAFKGAFYQCSLQKDFESKNALFNSLLSQFENAKENALACALRVSSKVRIFVYGLYAQLFDSADYENMDISKKVGELYFSKCRLELFSSLKNTYELKLKEYDEMLLNDELDIFVAKINAILYYMGLTSSKQECCEDIKELVSLYENALRNVKKDQDFRLFENELDEKQNFYKKLRILAGQ